MSCSTRKRLLIIRATKDFEQSHVDAVKAACQFVDVQPVEHSYTDLATLEASLSGLPDDERFAFVYLAAHGNHQEFGEQDPTLPGTRWADFANVLCRTKAMTPDSVLFMGCCGGGLKKVSLILFTKCEQITCVCGPRRNVSPEEITLALHVFLHSFVSKCEDPQIGAERTGHALGIKFRHHDRHDLATDLIMIRSVVGDDPEFLTNEQIQLRQPTTTTPPPVSTTPIPDFDCCPTGFWHSDAEVDDEAESDDADAIGACFFDGHA